ncbi:hypothetical protein FFLO_05620 [Filobasidium floriforme]|uniref:Beta-xylanase n=1 Tax=Filobasidium floriforme TaxID=5210 RepID=A0A8K0JH23_9TREE|nr:hypothetical protein FFLO_05620 [Filobasidium floriforme]
MLTTTVLIAILPLLASASPLTSRNNNGKNQKTGLNGLAARTGRYFGTATNSFNVQGLSPVGPYNDVLDYEFAGALTPENEGKWEVIQPQENVFNFTGVDIIVEDAKRIGALVRGHNFVWHQQTPSYVTNITDPEVLKQTLRTHVEAVAGRYKDDWAYLDVINEPLFENGTFRDSVWYNLLGEDYLEFALRTVHEVAPNIKLGINDYNIESVNEKSMAYARIAKNLLDKGAPLHFIGFESHFVGGQTPQDIAASMKQFTDLGLEVPLTELDVRVSVGPEDVANATGLTVQASDYGSSVQACVDNPLCPGVTVWQFYDPISWIPGVFPGEGAALPYDAAYKPKPAYGAIEGVLKGAKKSAQYKGNKGNSGK